MLAWERQENESAKAYEAFSLYRDLGPERSLARVGQTLGKSRALMERWSSRHDWVDRVRGLEDRDAMLKREAVEEHIQAQAEDHAAREARLREEALGAREEAMRQAKTMLRWPLSEVRRTSEDEDGNQVVYLVAPAGWSKATATSMFNLAMGNAQPPQDAESGIEYDFSQLTEEEMRAYIEIGEKIGVRRPEAG